MAAAAVARQCANSRRTSSATSWGPSYGTLAHPAVGPADSRLTSAPRSAGAPGLPSICTRRGAYLGTSAGAQNLHSAHRRQLAVLRRPSDFSSHLLKERGGLFCAIPITAGSVLSDAVFFKPEPMPADASLRMPMLLEARLLRHGREAKKHFAKSWWLKSIKSGAASISRCKDPGLRSHPPAQRRGQPAGGARAPTAHPGTAAVGGHPPAWPPQQPVSQKYTSVGTAM